MPTQINKIAGASLLSLRGLFDRLNQYSLNDEVNECARANAVVESLKVLRSELDVTNKTKLGVAAESFQGLVETQFDRANALIDAIEDRDQRDFLRRKLLENALRLVSPREPFRLRERIEKTLDQINGSDERQTAISAFVRAVSARFLHFPEEYDSENNKLTRLLEEIEFLDDYETLNAERILSYYFGARLSSEDSSGTFDEAFELAESLETNAGSFAFCDALPTELSKNSFFAAPLETLRFLMNAFEKLQERLSAIDQTLQSGVQYIGGVPEPLEEDELEDLKTWVQNVEILTPNAPDGCSFLCSFIERHSAYGMLESLFDVTRATSGASLGMSIPQFSSESGLLKGYDEKLASLSELAGKLFRANDGASVEIQAERLARLARLELVIDPLDDAKAKGKEAVREALALVDRLDSQGDRIKLYRSLITTHLDAGLRKPARKLLDRLTLEIEKVGLEMMRDFAKKEALPFYLALCNSEELNALADSIDSPAVATPFRAIVHSERAFRRAVISEEEFEPFTSFMDISLQMFLATDNLESDVAIEIMVEFASFLGKRTLEMLEIIRRGEREYKRKDDDE